MKINKIGIQFSYFGDLIYYIWPWQRYIRGYQTKLQHNETTPRPIKVLEKYISVRTGKTYYTLQKIKQDRSKVGLIRAFVLLDDTRTYNTQAVVRKLREIYPEASITEKNFLEFIES